MTGRGVAQWGATYFISVGAGWGIGWTLDAVLAEISFDYVFPPQYCTTWGLTLSLVVASVIAVGNDWLRAERLTWRAWGRSWVGLSALPVCLVSTSGVRALVVKLDLVGAASTLAPPARHAFCEGLVQGGLLGAIVAAGLILQFQRRALLIESRHGLTPAPCFDDSAAGN